MPGRGAVAWWWCLAALVLPVTAAAQFDGTCVPVAERAGRRTGCYITARHELGPLPARTPLYWHIDSYPTRSAAELAQGARGTVVESLGQTWLFSIEPESYRAAQGQHLARIGPLPLVDAHDFAATYMEGVFDPGMTTRVHRHPGVEAPCAWRRRMAGWSSVRAIRGSSCGVASPCSSPGRARGYAAPSC
jgi:hypothetical protein